MEDCLLNFHLHLYNLGLQIAIYLVLTLFYEFFDVLLPENWFQNLSISDILELAFVLIEEFLKQTSRKQTNTINFLCELLQKQSDHLYN